jgi:hydrogenase-4 membrane subunit HyfE
MIASIVLRLMTGIWALVLVLLGVVFVTLGLVLGDDQRTFADVGAAILALGVVLALVAWLLHSRARAERRRRREGAHAVAEVLDARLHTMTRIGVMLTYTATVRFAPAGAAERDITRTLLVPPTHPLVAGQRIEICYDPADPANFEPLSAVNAARGVT